MTPRLHSQPTPFHASCLSCEPKARVVTPDPLIFGKKKGDVTNVIQPKLMPPIE